MNTEVYTTFRAVFILSNMTSKDFNAIARGAHSETDVIWMKKDRKVDREEKGGRRSSAGRRIGPGYPPHL